MTDRVEMPHAARRETIGLAPELRTHRISDEELSMLVDQPHEPFSQIFTLALGVALAALYPALVALERWGSGPAPFSDLLMIVLLSASAPLALVMGVLWWMRRRAVRSLQAEIRARHRLPVESRAELRY